MPRLSKRTVQAAQPREKDYFVFDNQLPGFGLRVMPSGKKSYVIQYRRNRRTRRLSFGRYGPMTPDQARGKAIELLAAVRAGRDPAEEHAEARRAPSLATLSERFFQDYVQYHCKPSTAREYRRAIKLFINPLLGHISVRELTRPDVLHLHHNYRHIPYQANRTLGVLSKMLNMAELWGLRPDGSNPCRHIKKYPEKRHERFLAPEELARLGQVLRKVEAEGSEVPAAITAIRLLILTGCRLGEIQTLRWEYIFGNEIHLPDSKTGQKTVHLGAAARKVLDGIQRTPNNPYVIVGKKPGSHLTDLQHPWRRIRKLAKLEDVRIHDLRHSFASGALAVGESLPMIGKLLGHRQVQTTARYAHLASDPIKAAADRVSESLADSLSAPASEPGAHATK